MSPAHSRSLDAPAGPRLMARAPLLALLCAGLASACASVTTSGPGAPGVQALPIPATAETAAMIGSGDRADDPAIWVRGADAAHSLILGTNKDEGLYVYDLQGTELQRLEVGRLNNVDLRGDLVVASNDEFNAISWFVVTDLIAGEAAATVTHIADTSVEKTEPYGVCAGESGADYLAAVTYKDGLVQIWSTPGAAARGGDVSPRLTRTVQLASKLEGCVFDDAAQRLFIGEEARGFWSLDLSNPASEPVLVDEIRAGNGLAEDVEGISIWASPTVNGAGYLVVSAQGADRFVVYDRQPPHAPRGVFTVTESADGTVGAVTHTDGLDVTSHALPGYPMGLLVVQDDANPRKSQNQNFKLVDWSLISQALGLN